MRFFLPILLIGILTVPACDSAYDLSKVDTGDITIGGEESEFRIPLATVTVGMKELSEGDVDIKALFDEANIWLPSPLPGNAKYVDLQKLQNDSNYTENILKALIDQMLRDALKLDAVADLLSKDKYIGTFLPLLPPGTNIKDFKPVFKAVFQNDPTLRDKISKEVKGQAQGYLTTIKVDDITYDIGKIDIGDDIVDMIANNLDPKGTPNAKNTLHLYGEIVSALPVSLLLSPRFAPTEVEFSVQVDPDVQNTIRPTQLYADDLRQIIKGAQIVLPVMLQKYYPESGFTTDQKIVITLRLVKRGGLTLDI